MNRSLNKGFTYIGILLAIALIGTSLAGIGASWSLQKRRMDEAQLIYTGQAFRRAIASYVRAAPNGVSRYPRSLEELVDDRRSGEIQRHLRQVYKDPMTGRADWELITLADQSIIGVASRATARPLKRANFGPWEAGFEGAMCLCDWQFLYLPQLVDNSTVTP